MPNKINVDEDFCLLESVKSGKEQKVRTILSNECYRNTSFSDAGGRTALHWATEYGYTNLIYLLLDAKWNIDLKDCKLETPLHIACNHRRPDVAVSFISAGCDIEAADETGNTILQRAIHSNLEPVVNLLCKYGATINTKNKNGWTPLHEAVRVGNERVVRMLIENGADTNAVTHCKATPFSTTFFYYRIGPKNSYQSIDSILTLLITNGAHLSQSDGQWTPLFAAISICKSNVAASLLYHGCKVDSDFQNGRGLLLDAFTRCDSRVVKLLVSCGYRVTIEEVEQCARRIPTFSRIFRRLAFSDNDANTNGAKIISWLRDRSRNTLSLSELSRISIRKALNAGSDDKSILGNIRKLILPTILKDYIAISEIDEY